jgi:histidine decarboxylase
MSAVEPPRAVLPEGSADRTLTPAATARLDALKDGLRRSAGLFLGFPINFDHGAHCAPLHELLAYSMNNIGDPFAPSNYELHSRHFEKDVIDVCAELWGAAPAPAAGDDAAAAAAEPYWGYVSSASTEGNRFCLDIAGRAFPDATLYCSRATHFSVPGAATSFRLKLEAVATQPGDEIDYFALATALARAKAEAPPGRITPAIIVLNVGTTMLGAVDDVAAVLHILRALGYDVEREVYLHLDCALMGMMAPFMDFADAAPAACPTATSRAFALADAEGGADDADGLLAHKRAALAALPPPQGKGRAHPDFRHAAVASIVCSGHKFLGCPLPAGIVVLRGRYVAAVHETVEYLAGAKLVTSMGSRNGHSSVFLWHELQRKGRRGLAEDVLYCQATAAFLQGLMAEHRISCFLAPGGNTVVFERPWDAAFELTYSLVCQGPAAHAIVMPSVTRELLQRFVAAYVALRAGTWVASPQLGAPTAVPFPDRGDGCLVPRCGQLTVCFCHTCSAKRAEGN